MPLAQPSPDPRPKLPRACTLRHAQTAQHIASLVLQLNDMKTRELQEHSQEQALNDAARQRGRQVRQHVQRIAVRQQQHPTVAGAAELEQAEQELLQVPGGLPEGVSLLSPLTDPQPVPLHDPEIAGQAGRTNAGFSPNSGDAAADAESNRTPLRSGPALPADRDPDRTPPNGISRRSAAEIEAGRAALAAAARTAASAAEQRARGVHPTQSQADQCGWCLEELVSLELADTYVIRLECNCSHCLPCLTAGLRQALAQGFTPETFAENVNAWIEDRDAGRDDDNHDPGPEPARPRIVGENGRMECPTCTQQLSERDQHSVAAASGLPSLPPPIPPSHACLRLPNACRCQEVWDAREDDGVRMRTPPHCHCRTRAEAAATQAAWRATLQREGQNRAAATESQCSTAAESQRSSTAAAPAAAARGRGRPAGSRDSQDCPRQQGAQHARQAPLGGAPAPTPAPASRRRASRVPASAAGQPASDDLYSGGLGGVRGPQVRATQRRTLEEELTEMVSRRGEEMEVRNELEERRDEREAARQRLELELLEAQVGAHMRRTEGADESREERRELVRMLQSMVNLAGEQHRMLQEVLTGRQTSRWSAPSPARPHQRPRAAREEDISGRPSQRQRVSSPGTHSKWVSWVR